MIDFTDLPKEILEECLQDMEEKYNAGDKNQLLKAVRFCGRQKMVMPEWVVKSFHESTNEWYSLRVQTLDEAFGLCWPKGKQINAARKKREKGLAVYYAIRALHEEDKNENPLTMNTFHKVGEKFEISGATASDYYYEFDKQAKRVEQALPNLEDYISKYKK